MEQRSPNLVAAFRARLLEWDRARLVDSVVPLGRLIFDRPDRLAAVGALRMPRLVIASGADRSRSIGEGKAMAAAMDAPFVALPSAGHIASLEEPDPLSAPLLTWLDRALEPADNLTEAYSAYP
jgi:pimeloyl-ACP methyl ester carboxylesterase